MIRKDVVDELNFRCVKTHKYEVVPSTKPFLPADTHITAVHDDTTNDSFPGPQPPAFCLPLQELGVLVGRSTKVAAIYDTGSQIVVIRQDIVESLGIHINTQRLIEMEGANGITNWTVGCAKNLTGRRCTV